MTTTTAMLAWAMLAASPASIRLQAVVATSGDASGVLEGTGRWTPVGDARDEGILLRFEQPISVHAIVVSSCGGQFRTDSFVNGRHAAGPHAFAPGMRRVAPIASGLVVLPDTMDTISGEGELFSVSSFFVRVLSAESPPCIDAIKVLRDGAQIPLAPPRTVAGKVSASSVLAPADAYHPGYLFDGRIDFGWAEGAPGPGAGESVTVAFEKPTEVAGLELWNGYQRSSDHFAKNARARRLEVLADGAPAGHLDVADRMGAQRLALRKPVVASTLTLRIDSVWPGTRYPDLVLSELRFWDAAGPFTVRTPDREAQRAALLAAAKGRPLSEVIDRWYRAACGSEGREYAGHGADRTLKLRSDHTLVAYESHFAVDQPGHRSEVLDGTWVPSKLGSPWTEIELFARRHRTETSWVSEYEERRAETDRIAGGKIEVTRARNLAPEALAALVSEWAAGPARWRLACLSPAADLAEVRRKLVDLDAILVRGPAITEVFLSPPPSTDEDGGRSQEIRPR
jgi:hypothetical protein